MEAEHEIEAGELTAVARRVIDGIRSIAIGSRFFGGLQLCQGSEDLVDLCSLCQSEVDQAKPRFRVKSDIHAVALLSDVVDDLLRIEMEISAGRSASLFGSNHFADRASMLGHVGQYLKAEKPSK